MKNKGFTLIELLIVICITSIVAAAIGILFTNVSYSASDQRKKMLMQQNGRAAINFIADELLMAGYSPMNNVRTINIADLNRIRFTSDLNADGDTAGAKEDITLLFDSHLNELQIIYNNTPGIAAPLPITILENVESCCFLYAFDFEGKGVNGYGRLEQDTDGYIKWAYSQDSYYYFSSDNTLSLNQENSPYGNNKQIRAVKIMLLIKDRTKHSSALTGRSDFDLPGGEGIIKTESLETGFSYKLFTKTVKFRNMYCL